MESIITSLQHPLVKHLVKLREDKAYRHASKAILISGLKMIGELAQRFDFLSLLIEEDFQPPFPYQAKNTYRVPKQIIKKISGVAEPEPILAEISMLPTQDLSSADFLLILDGISDPGNLGTLLRSARGLGWDGVFLTPGSTDPYNEKALRAAKGATFSIPWKIGTYEELAILLKSKNMTLYSADAYGRDHSLLSFQGPLALALGNESQGLASPLKENATLLSIPMKGRMESLNVASAGAILMHELIK